MNESVEAFFPGRASIDIAALTHNLAVFRRLAGDAELMAVVKGNAYGHGRLQAAAAAIDAGVRWLGVSQLAEALQLASELDRAAIDRSDVTIFCWIAAPDADYRAALEAGLHLSASTPQTLGRIAEAARALGVRAPVHVKIDVGNSRGGAVPADFAELVRAAVALDDAIEPVAIWSHLPQADDPDGPGAQITALHLERFHAAVDQARELGLIPAMLHLAATPGTLWHPATRLDMVRIGIGVYGLSPNPAVVSADELGLRPVMTLEAPLILVKRIAAGEGVTYSATWRAEEPTWVGLVPLGYADGVPRAASNRAPVTVQSQAGPVPSRIIGRVCMDQFVIDLGTGPEPAARIGDRVVLFGQDGPSANAWADACDTINYEIVTRIASSVPRIYKGGRSL